MTYWQKNINQDNINTFKGWVGDFTAPTKQWVIEFINQNNISSMTDLGCAIADVYMGLLNSGLQVDYTGVDSCELFLTEATSRGAHVVNSDLLSYVGHYTDLVYSRHVLEHLRGMDDVDTLFSTVAVINPKWFVNVFFVPPTESLKLRKLKNYDDVHQNTYSADEITKSIIKVFPKCVIDWYPVGGEMIMQVKTNV
jgi:trans-aconitate methyltransferase